MSARPVIRQLAQLDDFATLSDAAAGTASLRTLGAGATQAAAGNHGHAASEITSGVLAMARLATGTPDGSKFVRDDGTLAVPAGGAGGLQLVPDDAADNTIQASTDVVPFTLKSRTASPPANLRVQEWQTSAGVVYGAISDVGAANLGGTTRTLKRAFFKSSTAELSVALTAEKAPGAASGIDIFTDTVIAAQGGYNADGAALRVFNIDSDRGTGSQGARGQEPATWIAQDGAIMTHKYMVISGTTAGALDTWQLQPPGVENNMLSVWCDTDAAGILVRPSAQATSYNIACLDDNADYRLTIEKDGTFRMGDHTTKAAMDVTFGRTTDEGVVLLESSESMMIPNNKFFWSKLAAGTLIPLFTVDTGNVMGVGQFDSGLARMEIRSKFRVMQPVSPYTIVFDITTSQIVHGFDTAIADGKNIVLNTTTGTKIATGATQKLAFHDSPPVIQRAGVAQAAVATTGSVLATFGYTTAAQADGIVTLLNEIRATLVEKGLMKGAA